LIEIRQNSLFLATWWLHGAAMARPRNDESPDLSRPLELTVSAIERLRCPTGKTQAFLRDSKAPALRVRVTQGGAKSFVFEAKLKRRTIRRTIGDVRSWTIEAARAEANRMRVLLDNGNDPREIERQQLAVKAAHAAAKASAAVTVGEAWQRYTAERRPHWGERNYADHVKMAQAGGEARTRISGVKTKPGPLAALMKKRLLDLDASAVEKWTASEAKNRPARVRLALRLLKAFLRWAASELDLKSNVDPTAASAKKTRELAGKAKPKNDYLQREQLSAWFEHVRAIPNPVISAYLQCLLLTGARREELAVLKWDDVNFQWRGMNLRDKIEGQRAVPLTPYVRHLISTLPRRNEWVFSSALVLDGRNAKRRERYHANRGTEAPQGTIATRSESGRIVEPSIAHRQACAAAGLELTLHGLRRSFASLCEWLDIPGGISAQIQGHAPQGVREQNYIRRPLDLLRVHHEKIEAWILAQAGVTFTPSDSATHLQAVA
jgi:integrase